MTTDDRREIMNETIKDKMESNTSFGRRERDAGEKKLKRETRK